MILRDLRDYHPSRPISSGSPYCWSPAQILVLTQDPKGQILGKIVLTDFSPVLIWVVWSLSIISGLLYGCDLTPVWALRTYCPCRNACRCRTAGHRHPPVFPSDAWGWMLQTHLVRSHIRPCIVLTSVPRNQKQEHSVGFDLNSSKFFITLTGCANPANAIFLTGFFWEKWIWYISLVLSHLEVNSIFFFYIRIWCHSSSSIKSEKILIHSLNEYFLPDL